MKGRERGRPRAAKEVLNTFADKLNIKFEQINNESQSNWKNIRKNGI